jgi:hypothetical protein
MCKRSHPDAEGSPRSVHIAGVSRSIWATEWIKNTHGDFYTAAVMLNDRLETVIDNYVHLLEENVAEKVQRLNEERYQQQKESQN